MAGGRAPALVPPDARAQIALGEAAAWMRPVPWSDLALASAVPDLPEAARRAMPLGLRDAWIVALREALFGAEWRAWPACAACGETYEMRLSPRDMGLGPDMAIAEARDGLRPVTLGDLLAVEGAPEPMARLLARVGAEGRDATEASAALEALDPAADLWLRATCPECGAEARHAFDPVLWLMRDFTRQARALLAEVVDLARAFHWTEAEILGLSPARRAYYLAELRT